MKGFRSFNRCGRWDLNPHKRNAYKILSLARLPVPTLPHSLEFSLSRQAIVYQNVTSMSIPFFIFITYNPIWPIGLMDIYRQSIKQTRTLIRCLIKKHHKPLSLRCSLSFVQCGRWDLNPHKRNAYKILSLARLPVPTLPHVTCSISLPRTVRKL